jgi:hypothetical protein
MYFGESSLSYRKEYKFPGCWVAYSMSIWSNVWSYSEVSLLIFCLDDLSIGDSGIFRPPTITMLVSISALRTLEFFNVDGCP